MECRFCEHPSCCADTRVDIPGIMRRVAVGNMVGARKCYLAHPAQAGTLPLFETRCVRALEGYSSVEISRIIKAVLEDQA